jgi:hypothetical protein
MATAGRRCSVPTAPCAGPQRQSPHCRLCAGLEHPGTASRANQPLGRALLQSEAEPPGRRIAHEKEERLGRSQGGSVNKLWWFIRNQIAKTISTSNRVTMGRFWRAATSRSQRDHPQPYPSPRQIRLRLLAGITRTYSRAGRLSVTPGNIRRCSMADDNSPHCPKTARIAAACHQLVRDKRFRPNPFNSQEPGEAQGEPDAQHEPVIRSHRRSA